MTQLLQNTVYGGAMILMIAALRRVLKNRLAPEVRLALWAVCLFRLLAPNPPESMLSLWGLGDWFGGRAQSAPAAVPPVPPSGQGYVAPTVPGGVAPVPVEAGLPWEMILPAVWLGVGAVLAVRYGLSWARTRRAVGRAIPLERNDPRYGPLPRCARLREGPMEGAPLTFGVARPTVVLFPGLEGRELECVLAHEGVHARRRDNLWHYAMAVAVAVHWWNPAVWLMARLLRRDVELSCDRAALRRLGPERRAEYANALVSMATGGNSPAFCQTFGRKAAEERIVSIMKYKKTTIIGAALSLVLVLGVTAGFASDPVDEESTTSSAPAGFTYGMTSDPDSGMLKSFTISLDFLEKSLAEHVADGSMTQGEADRVLALAKEEARNSDQSDRLEWTFQGDSGLVDLSVKDGLYQPGFHVYYEDGDGRLILLDPATVVSGFIFGNGTKTVGTTGNADIPTYVEGDPANGVGEAIGEVGSEFYAYELTDGERVAVGGVVGTEQPPTFQPSSGGEFIITDVDTNGNLVVTDEYGTVYPEGTTMKEYQALLDRLVAGGVMTQAQAREWRGDMEQALEQLKGNEINHLMFNRTNSAGAEFLYACWADPVVPQAEPQGYVPCTAESCASLAAHYHENGAVVYLYDTQPIEVCGLPLATQGQAACSVDGCTETAHHTHVDGHCLLLDDPCPVEGCTQTGSHLHNGVSYSCNGAGHSGGHCDGSCYSYNELPQYVESTPSRTNCYPSHSESHHSSGHHRGHH